MKSLSLGVFLLFTSAACAGPMAERPGPSTPRPELPASQSGVYLITRSGHLVGREEFTISASEQRWRCDGRIELQWPVEQVQTYSLEYDPVSAEPLGFSVRIEIMEEAPRVIAVVSEGYLRAELHAIEGTIEVEVPYAKGTLLDFGSPLFNSIAFALLGPSLKEGEATSVRTITIPVPFLRPAVLLQEYRLFGEEDALQKIAVGPPGRRPTAFWVRAGGLPVKVKTWAEEGGAPFVYQLEGASEIVKTSTTS